MKYERLTPKDLIEVINSNDKENIAFLNYAMRLHTLEDKIENGTLCEQKTCIWEEWEDDWLGSVWCCSNCKEDFCFTEGSVQENNYGYCPHCGAKIVELKELKEEV